MASRLQMSELPMQLRVARLCLDCEELHTESRCPKCISEHYAMVSTWLPVEERRRFRKPSPPPQPRKRGIVGVLETIARWIEGGTVVEAPNRWATRRSDQLARELNHDAAALAGPHPIDPRQTERADVAQ
jgi:hypothetical protein